MFWIFKKRFDFYRMLVNQTRKSQETLEALNAYLEKPTKDARNKVDFAEKEADRIRGNLVMALNASFVTPFDREDINGLSRAIDDMADYAKSTVQEMEIFEVAPDAHLREMAQAMELGARMTLEAVSLLSGDGPSRNERVGELLVKIKKTENYIEKKYRQALKDLFSASDIILILKTREIYRHLSNAADRMDEAANILGDILMKTG
ncbi:MAG: DUF47 family protein [Elusimicrobiota bacterium]